MAAAQLAPRRPNRFEIDLGAVAHNLAQVRLAVGPATRIFAALKADAYGFGLGQVADVVASGGANAIAVADLADAASLRERGLTLPILAYPGYPIDARVVAAVESLDLMPTVFDREAAETYASAARGTVRIFVKVDVGLERLGVVPEETVSLVRHIRDLPKLELHGLYTHLDVRDDPRSPAYITWQLRRYFDVCEALEAHGVAIPIKLVASSAVLRYTREVNLDAVDPGHILFGLVPPGPVGVDLDLRPAFRALKSRLIHARAFHRQAFRDLSPVAPRPGMRIGVIPIGLRDGMGSLTCGEVLVRGRRVPIVGAFSLEHTRVDLTDVPEAGVGDEVVIIGEQGGAAIRPAEVTRHQGFSVKAALAMAIRGSVERVYL